MKWISASIITLSIILSGLIGTPLHAQSSDVERKLSISPLRTEFTIPAGTSQSGSLTVYNTGKQPLDIQMNTLQFTVTDNDYNYVFNENSTINQWIRYDPANFTLQPNTSKVVTYSINVPITASIGDKYFSLFASTAPGTTSSPITTTERVGSVVYLTVPGEITRDGKLINLRSPLFTGGNTTWSATIQNTGTSLFRSNYSMSLQTLWGQEVMRKEGSALILSNSVRLVSDDLNMPQWLGIYKATYSIELGDSPTAVVTYPIIYLPLLQTIFLLTVIGIIIGWLIARVRSRKQKKKTSSSAE
ncbi:MAG: hypothetical protein WAO28_01710 [Candidatus Microsaccharimonas sp.]